MDTRTDAPFQAPALHLRVGALMVLGYRGEECIGVIRSSQNGYLLCESRLQPQVGESLSVRISDQDGTRSYLYRGDVVRPSGKATLGDPTGRLLIALELGDAPVVLHRGKASAVPRAVSEVEAILAA